MLDLPEKQYSHHESSQHTCGGEDRGKCNKLAIHIHFCVYQQHFPYTIQALQRAEDHLTLVTQEQSLYREALDESRRHMQAHFLLEGKCTPPPPHGMIAPASNNIMVHYSFDFAQQVHYPSNPLQPGPIYF